MSNFKCVIDTKRNITRSGAVPLFPEGLYSVGKNLYAWMVPNGSWGETNSGLVVGKKESLLIDTCWDPMYTEEIFSFSKNIIRGAPITHVVNTHADGDHCWGNQLFQNVNIYSTKNCQDMMQHITPKQMNLLNSAGSAMSLLPIKSVKRRGKWLKKMLDPYSFSKVKITLPNSVFTGEHVLNLSGREVILIEMGPAHTGGDCIVYIPDEDVVYSGDLIFVGSTPVVWSGPVENWINSLEKIIELKPKLIIPGHGPITDVVGIKNTIEYLDFIYKQSLTKYEKDLPPYIAAKEILYDPSFKYSKFSSWIAKERVLISVFNIYRNLDRNVGKYNFNKLNLLNYFLKQGSI